MNVYIVVEGGCVRYVSSDLPDTVLNVAVVDLDDMRDAEDLDRVEIKAKLDAAEALPPNLVTPSPHPPNPPNPPLGGFLLSGAS